MSDALSKLPVPEGFREVDHHVWFASDGRDSGIRYYADDRPVGRYFLPKPPLPLGRPFVADVLVNGKKYRTVVQSLDDNYYDFGSCAILGQKSGHYAQYVEFVADIEEFLT